MAFTQFKHSGTLNPEISVCEKKHSSFAEKAAEEGIVLLKNENILPISLSASVALLGKMCIRDSLNKVTLGREG